MGDTKHTPGSWRVTPWSQQEAAVVARVGGKDRHIGGYLLNADAHLSAAAPCLHKAGRALMPDLYAWATDHGIGRDEWHRRKALVEALSEALAKARGEIA